MTGELRNFDAMVRVYAEIVDRRSRRGEPAACWAADLALHGFDLRQVRQAWTAIVAAGERRLNALRQAPSTGSG